MHQGFLLFAADAIAAYQQTAELPLFSPLSSSLLPFLPSRKPIDSLIGLPDWPVWGG